ncbi:MAG TPA: cation:proton antiporter [Terriglobales bacterium]|nr:cation:proton antiporter [Terriglobales bacterium]
MDFNGSALLLTAFIAVLAPLICALPARLRLPMVAVEVGLGILVGPNVLGWATPTGMLGLLGHLGMIFLFYLAGMEIELSTFRGRPLKLAVTGWVLSAGIAFGLTALLYAVGFCQSPLLIAVATCTTAIGALLPILRDTGELNSAFGRHVLAAGAIGEFGPIILVSLLLTREHTRWEQTALMLGFVVVSLVASGIALIPRPTRLETFLERTMNAPSQLPVRIAILVLATLVVLAEDFGMDMILGAFAAGMVTSLGTKGGAARQLHSKLEAIGFGFLIPMFFVTSGMHFDLATLFRSHSSWLRVPVFLAILMIARAAPTILYRYELDTRDRLPFALYSATSLPLMIAIAEIGTATGRMQPGNAAALVAAGMISVVLFPSLAYLLRTRGKQTIPAAASSPGGQKLDFARRVEERSNPNV